MVWLTVGENNSPPIMIGTPSDPLARRYCHATLSLVTLRELISVRGE
jgi:hypothetical protein